MGFVFREASGCVCCCHPGSAVIPCGGDRPRFRVRFLPAGLPSSGKPERPSVHGPRGMCVACVLQPGEALLCVDGWAAGAKRPRWPTRPAGPHSAEAAESWPTCARRRSTAAGRWQTSPPVGQTDRLRAAPSGGPVLTAVPSTCPGRAPWTGARMVWQRLLLVGAGLEPGRGRVSASVRCPCSLQRGRRWGAPSVPGNWEGHRCLPSSHRGAGRRLALCSLRGPAVQTGKRTMGTRERGGGLMTHHVPSCVGIAKALPR